MTGLFEELTEFRDAAVEEFEGRRLGGLLATLTEHRPTTELWRPFGRSGSSPWLEDPVWPSSLRTPRCQVMLLARGERLSPYYGDKVIAFAAGCTGCGWLSDERPAQMQALAEGLDHSHPGWWALPIVRSLKAGAGMADRAKWARTVARMYPTGWFESAGPVRTHRQHAKDGFGYVRLMEEPIAGGAPGGGWDVPGIIERKVDGKAEAVRMVFVPTKGVSSWELRDAKVLGPDGELVREADLLRELEAAERKRRQDERDAIYDAPDAPGAVLCPMCGSAELVEDMGAQACDDCGWMEGDDDD